MKNSSYDKVTVIGVAVCVIAFVLIIFFKPGMPKNAAGAQPQIAAEKQNADAMPQTAQPADAANAQNAATAENSAPAASATVTANVVSAPWRKPENAPVQINIAGESSAFIDPLGAGVQKTVLNNYYLDLNSDDKGNHDLVTLGNYDFPSLALTPPNSDFSFSAPSSKGLDEAGQTYSIVRDTINGKLRVAEHWTAQPDKPYELVYSVTFENISDAAVELSGYRIEVGAMPSSVAANRKSGRGEASGAASYGQPNGKSEDLNIKSLSKLDQKKCDVLASTSASWLAVHSKYFVMAAWLQNDNFAGLEAAAVPAVQEEGKPARPDSRYHLRGILPFRTIDKGSSLTYTITSYTGPKMFERLYAYHNDLDAVMEMDRFFFWRPMWMRQLSRGLLKLLVKISAWFPKSCGYGMAVIFLTLLVKLIFWPLSHKQTIASRKMAALKPQIDEINEKYKDDPQTKMRKQQELYKANNINQLGGCLPMLLQIPVFFSLYNTFRNAIEMRHAAFLWVYDLSMPDTLSFSPDAVPIRPLALCMGLAMFLQQKLTPTPDPQQAKMMNFMSIFFIFLFYSMPSALTLYWTVSYLLTILQILITNKFFPPQQPPLVAVRKP